MNYPNRPPQGGARQGGQGGFRSESATTPLPPIDLQCDAQQFIKTAEACAKIWTEGREKATTSQIRRFYGEIKRLEQLIKQKGDELGWLDHEIEVRMLKPKAAYARVTSGKAPEALVDFIKTGVDKSKTVHDFKRFVLLFEATIGFAYPDLKTGN